MPAELEEWRKCFSNDGVIRSAFAKAAKRAGWFKRVDQAQKLGKLVTGYWNDIAQKLLGVGIAQLKEWVYEN